MAKVQTNTLTHTKKNADAPTQLAQSLERRSATHKRSPEKCVLGFVKWVSFAKRLLPATAWHSCPTGQKFKDV